MPSPSPGEPGPASAALVALRRDPRAAAWCGLRFFTGGEADRIAAKLDAAIADGARLAPPPDAIFRALTLTPLAQVKAVILGQDPYPTPGAAHGLAFSHVGPGRLPASLRVILAEVAADCGHGLEPATRPPGGGDLARWAGQGVLLLNAALTTVEGTSGAHLRLGWEALADEVVTAVSARQPAVAFLLWGASARARAPLVDRARHLVVESGHPSPLNRARDFPGSRPFSRANAFLASRGLAPIDWCSPAAGR